MGTWCSSAAASSSTVGRLQGQGWQVADDGTVSVRPGSSLDIFARLSPVNRMLLQALAANASLDLQTMLAQFESTDDKVGQQVRDAVAALNGPGTKEPPAPSSPKSLVDRLAGMTPDERAAFLAGLEPGNVARDGPRRSAGDGQHRWRSVRHQDRSQQHQHPQRTGEEQKKQPPDDARVKQLQAMLTPIKDPQQQRHQLVPRKFVAVLHRGQRPDDRDDRRHQARYQGRRRGGPRHQHQPERQRLESRIGGGIGRPERFADLSLHG